MTGYSYKTTAKALQGRRLAAPEGWAVSCIPYRAQHTAATFPQERQHSPPGAASKSGSHSCQVEPDARSWSMSRTVRSTSLVDSVSNQQRAFGFSKVIDLFPIKDRKGFNLLMS